jgi:general transcription factor 3C polypeptide 3 (transcription factor C subunit 4)
MANRLRRARNDTEELDEEDEQLQEEEELHQKMLDESQFRGISFDRWLRVIIKYAYMLAFSRRTEEAYEILKKTSESNIFYYDIPNRTSVKLAIIGKYWPFENKGNNAESTNTPSYRLWFA